MSQFLRLTSHLSFACSAVCRVPEHEQPLVARTIQTPPCVADRPRGVNASGVEQVLVLLEITCAGLPGKQVGLFAYSQTFGKTWSVSQGCVGPSSFALFLAGHQISGSSAVSIGSEQSAQHESIAASVQITLQHVSCPGSRSWLRPSTHLSPHPRILWSIRSGIIALPQLLCELAGLVDQPGYRQDSYCVMQI